jgi:hypothetical protein
MGLTHARRVVERHQGAIEVQSEPEKGSTFIVDLPVSQHSLPQLKELLSRKVRCTRDAGRGLRQKNIGVQVNYTLVALQDPQAGDFELLNFCPRRFQSFFGCGWSAVNCFLNNQNIVTMAPGVKKP